MAEEAVLIIWGYLLRILFIHSENYRFLLRVWLCYKSLLVMYSFPKLHLPKLCMQSYKTCYLRHCGRMILYFILNGYNQYMQFIFYKILICNSSILHIIYSMDLYDYPIFVFTFLSFFVDWDFSKSNPKTYLKFL